MPDELPADDEHRRPAGASDADVEAAGKMSEALEYLERARGHLYEFHQLMGHTDLLLDEVVEQLRGAGHDDLADAVGRVLVARTTPDGRWTFQIVEEFDDGYYADFRRHEHAIRDALTAGRRHVYESEMKERRRTKGDPRHTARP